MSLETKRSIFKQRSISHISYLSFKPSLSLSLRGSRLTFPKQRCGQSAVAAAKSFPCSLIGRSFVHPKGFEGPHGRAVAHSRASTMGLYAAKSPSPHHCTICCPHEGHSEAQGGITTPMLLTSQIFFLVFFLSRQLLTTKESFTCGAKWLSRVLIRPKTTRHHKKRSGSNPEGVRGNTTLNY